jgi:hypothetical protein
LRGIAFSAAVLRRSIRGAGLLTRSLPIMAEEFVRTEDARYELPIEYKFHTFGDTVAAVEVIERATKRARRLFYTADWQPIADPMHVRLPPAEPREPPRCLGDMLRHATTLGLALGTYMRVDFFATPHGCVFNEFSSTPGDGERFTPYCDELFGSHWEEKFPHAT